MEVVEKVLTVLGIVMVVAILLAWPVQVLWNGCLVQAVDGIHPIGFWQALGINVLFSFLFKSTNSK